jgi:hypothetical protein
MKAIETQVGGDHYKDIDLDERRPPNAPPVCWECE